MIFKYGICTDVPSIIHNVIRIETIVNSYITPNGFKQRAQCVKLVGNQYTKPSRYYVNQYTTPSRYYVKPAYQYTTPSRYHVKPVYHTIKISCQTSIPHHQDIMSNQYTTPSRYYAKPVYHTIKILCQTSIPHHQDIIM